MNLNKHFGNDERLILTKVTRLLLSHYPLDNEHVEAEAYKCLDVVGKFCLHRNPNAMINELNNRIVKMAVICQKVGGGSGNELMAPNEFIPAMVFTTTCPSPHPLQGLIFAHKWLSERKFNGNCDDGILEKLEVMIVGDPDVKDNFFEKYSMIFDPIHNKWTAT